MIIDENEHYQITMTITDSAFAEAMGDRTEREGTYHLVNKETGVVEMKTMMLPQAIVGMQEYTRLLRENRGNQENEKLENLAGVVAFDRPERTS